ncbi:hypothetical protein GCM10009691_35280 [Brevibacterium picturae]|uniref:Uncharacterized protein n=1 Tax=Brevibacterium picturae TaxID=260553 RepID=A0ABP4NBL4_9MICO
MLRGVVQDRCFLSPHAGHRPAHVQEADGLDGAFAAQQPTDGAVGGLDHHREHHAGRPLIGGVVSQSNHDRVLPLTRHYQRRCTRHRDETFPFARPRRKLGGEAQAFHL